MTHPFDPTKADLANRVAQAVGVKRPLDYDSRSTRRGIENRLEERFNLAKQRISKYGDVTNASVCDIMITDNRLAIAQGLRPRIDIESARKELKNLEIQYKRKFDTPTSGRRGSQGQKNKQLALIESKIKPLRTLVNNYPCGSVLFAFPKIDFPKKEIPKPKPIIEFKPKPVIIEPIPIIPVLEPELEPESILKFSVPIALSIAGVAYLLIRSKKKWH